jgi:hypothetical protein
MRIRVHLRFAELSRLLRSIWGRFLPSVEPKPDAVHPSAVEYPVSRTQAEAPTPTPPFAVIEPQPIASVALLPGTRIDRAVTDTAPGRDELGPETPTNVAAAESEPGTLPFKIKNSPAVHYIEPIRLSNVPVAKPEFEAKTAIAKPPAVGREEFKLRCRSKDPAEPHREPIYKVAPRRERQLIVGVDFGTSTTKVVWQDLSDNSFEAFKWCGQSGTEGSLLLPSTITLRGNELHFGIAGSEIGHGDIWLHSIKLCVLCTQNTKICRCKNEGMKEGRIRLPGHTDEKSASALASLLLGFVFRVVEVGLTERYPDDDLVLIWNIGCPMDHLDLERRRVSWERMVGTAMEMRSKISNPCDCGLLAESAELMKWLTVPSPAERNFMIQPEGLASVKAFLESPQAESKTYLIVDVGAGTTEISYFFNGRAMNELGTPFKPLCVEDSTEPIGGGKIDQELSTAWNCSVEDARSRKERKATGFPDLRTVSEICDQYRRTFDRVTLKKKLTARSDKKFDLFLIGGGSRLDVVNDALRNCQIRFPFERDQIRKLMPPDRLSDGKELSRHFDVIANACGLASSLEWEYYPSSKIEPIKPPSGMPTNRPNFGEIYDK